MAKKEQRVRHSIICQGRGRGVSIMRCVNAIMQLYASLFECLTCHLHMKDLMAFALN